MDLVPAEIWNEIFSFACMDGGFTGRSLSLVSKHVAETTKALKFQSLSVVGFEQLSALTSILENTPASLRQVRYLFIAAISPRTGRDPKVLGREYTRRREAWNTFKRILIAVASSLEILHTLFIFQRPYPLLPISLPVLRDLALHGPSESEPEQESIPDVTFPSLQHVHLGSPYPPSFIFERIVPQLPNLHYLRVCCLEHSHSYASDFARALKESDATRDTHHIRKIYLHRPTRPRDDWLNSLTIYEGMIMSLEEMVRGDGRLVLLDPFVVGIFRTVSIEDAQAEWEDSVLNGGWWSHLAHERSQGASASVTSTGE